MIPIEKLVVAPTTQQVYDQAVALLEGLKIPARSWHDGSTAQTVLGVVCQIIAQFAAIVASLAAGCYLAFATGDYLTAHVSDVYDEDRIGATFATGQILLRNDAGVTRTYDAGTLIVSASQLPGVPRFRVTDPVSLAPGTELPFAVQAVEAGAASSVGPGDIDTIETPIAKLSVRNTAAIIGRDAETDAELVTRARAKKGTWSVYGPRDSYLSAALGAKLPDGTPTSINRVSISRASSNNAVTIVCATASGSPSPAELAAVVANIEAKSRTDSAKVSVLAANPVPCTKSVIIWARGGVEATIRANAQAAVNALFAGWPIGGVKKTDDGQGALYDDKLEATIVSSSPQTFDVDFASGAGDLVLGAADVATNAVTFDVRIRP